MKTSLKRATRVCVIFFAGILIATQVGCGKKAGGDNSPSAAGSSATEETPKNPDAQVDLAYKHYLGKEVPRSYPRAAELFQLAAKAGDARAQFALGVMHQNGQGVPINYMEAAKWYQKSAKQDNPDAQYLLGLSYKEGSGVAKDSAEAYKWMHLAAEQGNPDYIEARNHLALLLTPDVVGEGLRRAQQFHIYELAAKNKATAEDDQIAELPPEN